MRARPPFIWTPEQPIEPMGFLAAMQNAPERDDGQNRWHLLRRTVTLPSTPDEARVRITCDGRYQLWVNGQRMSDGPIRSAAMALKVDEVEIASTLRAGENTLAVIVHTPGVDTAFYEMVRGMWQPTFGDGGLWINGTARCGDDVVPISTREEWRLERSAAWVEATERMNSGLGFVEVLDGRALPQDWMEVGFDDNDWPVARALHVDGGGPDAFFGGLDVEPFPILARNPLPPMAVTHVAPTELRLAKTVELMPELPVHQQLYQEPFTGDAKANLRPLLDGSPVTITTEEGLGITVLFGFDRMLTGCPFVEVKAHGGEEIDIAVAERLPGEYEANGFDTNARIMPSPVLGNDAHIARYTCRPGRQRFERFEWSAVRWMQVTIRRASAGLTILELGCVDRRYPAPTTGTFDSSDPMLDQLWTRGAYTLSCCMHDAWEDCPSREQRQWLGDVTVENAAAQVAFGPQANPLTAKYLRDVADSQRPDGLTQMFAPGDHKVNGILIPDWSLQWVLTAGDYLRWTGDVDTIADIFPAIERTLAWFERLRTSHDLVADLPYWHFMDWSAVGRKGEAATLNAQLAGALDAAAAMADALEAGRSARVHRARADAIRAALNARHWDERRGAYVDMVDPVTAKQDPRVSQHANAAMILWGGAPADRWARMIDRIANAERLTFTAAPPIVPLGEPLDEEEGVVLANTFYSHFVYSALAKAGRMDAALDLIRGRYARMVASGSSTLWESFDPTASLCHGFSASPTFQLSAHVLGLSVADGGRKIDFAPDLGGLERASGGIETVRGRVDVSLTRNEGIIEAELTLPEGLAATVSPRCLPEGGARHLTGGRTHRLGLRR